MNQTQASLREISPEILHRDSGFYLIDVRTPVEFNEKSLPAAELYPLHDLVPSEVIGKAGGRPVCLICQSGKRARQAAAKLREAGCESVAVLAGGVEAWESAGLPLRRGAKGISLERQVRIAAGLLVLAGVGGALWLHPGFIALSGFVGAGLVFAGLTDWCGMGLLLARMPWNRTRASCCAVKE